MVKSLPNAAYLRECLDYDPSTGDFIWKVRPLRHFVDTEHGNTWNTRYARKPAGHTLKSGYHQIVVADTRFMAHRLAWLLTHGEPVPEEIDHIDGNRSNNQIGNLRVASRAENIANSRLSRHNSSGAKGVWFDHARGKFQAHIMHLYKYYHLGRFDTLEEAVAARRDAAERLHGKFARDG